MKTVRLSQLKAELSKYVARVRRGEEVVVTDRGRPVAKLVPIPAADLPDPVRLAALEREGQARQGREPLPASFWTRRRPRDPEGRGRRALLDERESGR